MIRQHTAWREDRWRHGKKFISNQGEWSWRSQPCQQLDLELSASRTVRKYTSIV
jgi:hypothetical protein